MGTVGRYGVVHGDNRESPRSYHSDAPFGRRVGTEKAVWPGLLLWHAKCGPRSRIWETVHSQRFDYFCPSVWPERSQGRESLSLRPTWYMHLHPPDLTFLSVPSSCSRDPSSSTSVQQPHSVGSSRTACSKLSVVETASIPFFLIRDTACFAYLLFAPSFYRNKVI